MLFYAKTDQGQVRSHNEDFVFASDAPVGSMPNLFLVADGMGGHKAGECASEMAIKIVVAYMREHKDEDPEEALLSAFSEANEAVYREAGMDPDKHGMGTTLVAAVVDKDRMYVANVGDSRLYIKDSDGLTQITRDHSLIEEMIRSGTLSKSQAIYHPDKHKITRAIGAEAAVLPDFFDVSVSDAKKILLCTDGLTNMVSDADINDILGSTKKVKEQAEQLIEEANRNGGRDNITVLVIDAIGEE